jgi:hypothetical protein
MLDSFISDQFIIRSISGGEQRRRAEFFSESLLVATNRIMLISKLRQMRHEFTQGLYRQKPAIEFSR